MRGLVILSICVLAFGCAPLDDRDFRNGRLESGTENSDWRSRLGVTQAGHPYSYSSYGRLPPTFGAVSEKLGSCGPLENDDLQPGYVSACREYRRGEFKRADGDEWTVDCSEGMKTCIIRRPLLIFNLAEIHITAEGISDVCIRGSDEHVAALSVDNHKWVLGEYRGSPRFQQCMTKAQLSEFSAAFHVGAKIQARIEPSDSRTAAESNDVIGPAYPDAVRLARYILHLRQPVNPGKAP
jgi:hypothetical protein